MTYKNNDFSMSVLYKILISMERVLCWLKRYNVLLHEWIFIIIIAPNTDHFNIENGQTPRHVSKYHCTNGFLLYQIKWPVSSQQSGYKLKLSVLHPPFCVKAVAEVICTMLITAHILVSVLLAHQKASPKTINKLETRNKLLNQIQSHIVYDLKHICNYFSILLQTSNQPAGYLWDYK